MAAESDSDTDGDDEWNPADERQDGGIAPEDQDRFRRLLTELMFSGAGAPVLLVSAAWLPDICDFSGLDGDFLDLSLLLGALGFGCVVWLVTAVLRLARIRRKR
jgi:hypothetical protein